MLILHSKTLGVTFRSLCLFSFFFQNSVFYRFPLPPSLPLPPSPPPPFFWPTLTFFCPRLRRFRRRRRLNQLPKKKGGGGGKNKNIWAFLTTRLMLSKISYTTLRLVAYSSSTSFSKLWTKTNKEKLHVDRHARSERRGEGKEREKRIIAGGGDGERRTREISSHLCAQV